MQNKKIVWLEGVDYVIYPKIEDGFVGYCCHCGKKSKNARSLQYEHKNFCKELHKEDDDDKLKQVDITSFLKGKAKQIKDEKITEIVRFICETATPINAVQNKHFRKLTNTNFSSAKIREEIIKYAEELKKETKNKIQHRLVSLVVDGATINSTSGWYAVGLATRSSIYFYDVIHMSSTTTIALTTKFKTIIDEIEGETEAKVIGSCSDNAFNISHVFDPDNPDGLAQRFGKYLLRVPCQAHTANLVNTTYLRENPEYDAFHSKIKEFCNKASRCKIHELLGISCSCPLIRDQRWYTEFDALRWVVQYREVIEENFATIAGIMEMSKCPITEDWQLLMHALSPLRQYTTIVESNVHRLGKSYLDFLQMRSKMISLSESNKFAKDLLGIIDRRWSSTADIELLKLANFVDPVPFFSWRKKYDLLGKKVSVNKASAKEKGEFAEMNEEISRIVAATVKYGLHYNFKFKGNEDSISYIITMGKICKSLVFGYFWESQKVTIKDQLKSAAKLGFTSFTESCFEDIMNFYNYVCGFPSSEAFIERVFSNMRLLFPSSRASVNDDLVRAQTLVRMVSSFDDETAEINRNSFP